MLQRLVIDALQDRQDERGELLFNQWIFGEEMVAFRGNDRRRFRKEKTRQQRQTVVRTIGPHEQIPIPTRSLRYLPIDSC